MSGWVTQDAAANAGVFSVYLTTIMYIDLQLFFDRKREYTLFHYCVTFIGILATINLYYLYKRKDVAHLLLKGGLQLTI